MGDSSKSIDEKTIKNKKRVQNHGEVFTPKRITKQMLALPGIDEACQNLTNTFLEPAAGEGVFLIEVLKRKIKMVGEKYGDNLGMYENYSLLALSTLYGVELLEDNARKCIINIYQVYYEAYQRQAKKHGKKAKIKVLNSAKLIISKNIVEGNFLTKISANSQPIVFCEWKAINLHKATKTIIVQRTEYTLFDIVDGVEKENGETSRHLANTEQLDMFSLFDSENITKTQKKQMKYIPVKIVDLYKEEMEETDE